MKSAKFIHVGFVLTALIAGGTLPGFAFRALMGYEPVMTWMVIIAVVAPVVFYFMWLLDRRKKQKNHPLIIDGFWVSYVICSAVVSYWALGGCVRINQPTVTVDMGIHLIMYVLASCLPIALILMTLYIVSETREKRRN